MEEAFKSTSVLVKIPYLFYKAPKQATVCEGAKSLRLAPRRDMPLRRQLTTTKVRMLLYTRQPGCADQGIGKTIATGSGTATVLLPAN